MRGMRRGLVALACLIGAILPLTNSSTARADISPAAVARPPEPSNAPLVIATEPPPVPVAKAAEPVAVEPPPEAKPPGESKVIGAWSAGVLSPILTVARGAPFSFTWLGVSMLAYSGRGWLVPAPDESGPIARFGGRISVFDAMPITGWPLDVGAEYGRRFALGASHHVYIAAGAHGSVSALATKYELDTLHLPEVSFGYQRHGRGSFAEVGALGGLSMAGRYAVGTDLSSDEEGARFGSTHFMRPYAGAHASILLEPVMVSLMARRTLLEGGTGRALDQGQGMMCGQLVEARGGGASFGGCVTADVFRGELAREAPAPGPGGEVVSLRIGLNIMMAQVVGP